MGVLLGLAAAVAYGSSDFIAGLLSRRASYLQVAAVGQAVAVVCTGIAIPFTSPAGPDRAAIGWGIVSGVGVALGSLALYRGLAAGQMAVAGPLSGVGAAALPALAGIALGERPSVGTVAGIVLALPAVWLVSTVDRPAAGTGPVSAGVRDGLLAGVGFAVLFFGLDRAGTGDTGLWPVAVAQGTSVVLLAAAVLLRRPPRLAGHRMTAAAGSVGLLGGAATVLFFLATNKGLLAVAAVLTALYPAFTVLLARLTLGERLSRVQTVGLCVAAVAVTLIVTG
ncbi:MAG: DMT family transporter [Actinomycetota bacterium]|nr:DMT family transporter [Actinomycetota bacterium]